MTISVNVTDQPVGVTVSASGGAVSVSAATVSSVTVGIGQTAIPEPHAGSHGSGGSDPITVAQSQVSSSLGNSDIAADISQIASSAANASNLTSGTVASERLPLATTTAAGAIIIGSGLTITDGVVSASGGGAVASVAGKTGTVTLVKGDVDLGNVDNTSDANKPVSTATQTALDGKASSSHGHGNITNDGRVGTTAGLLIATTNGGVLDVASGLANYDVGDCATDNFGTDAPLGDVLRNIDAAFDGRALSSHSHAASDITSGTIAIGRIPAGTTSSTVCIGNDARLSDARTPASHVHAAGDITSGTLAIGRIPTGSTSSTVCVGDDARLSDARSPASHTHSQEEIASSIDAENTLADDIQALVAGIASKADATDTNQALAQKAALVHSHAASDITSGTIAIGRIPTGTTSSTVCIGNDARLSDARTPASHSHGSITNDGKIGSTSGLIVTTGTAGALQASSTIAPERIASSLGNADLYGDINSLQGAIGAVYTYVDSNVASCAPSSHTHAASDITSGTIATARLGSGTADATTWLRGDQTFANPVTFANAEQKAALRGALDAEDWSGRVVTAGGDVSQATFDAVAAFCTAIHSSPGLRQRFWRANLFAGSNLVAATVPLWRSTSRSGTQYGNAVDTNFNFAVGDYAETGSSGGLTGTGNNGVGAGNAKHLRTGLNQSVLATSNLHLSAFVFGLNGTAAIQQGFVAIRNNTAPANRWWLEYRGAINVELGASAGFGGISAQTGNRLILSSRESSTLLRAYVDGSQHGSDITTDITSSLANRAADWYVFAANVDGSPSSYCLFRMGFYSIGLSLTSAQAAVLNSAIVSFNTALSRT